MASVDQLSICACKGIRTCLLCENNKSKSKTSGDNVSTQERKEEYLYCVQCQKAWKQSTQHKHPNHSGDPLDFPGILVIEEFINEEEEATLVSTIDKTPWTDSQSGRKKQDFGPKVNFKKKKLRLNCFTGLPAYSKRLVERFKQHKLLSDFIPVELCNLEYVCDRGSAIDPHFDDFWLWGERLITLNTLSDTYLTMSRDATPDMIVHVPMPGRSLVVVYGPARYDWKHAVLRQNITSRRLATTFRELTPEFLTGGNNEELGNIVIKIASTFDGQAVGCLPS